MKATIVREQKPAAELDELIRARIELGNLLLQVKRDTSGHWSARVVVPSDRQDGPFLQRAVDNVVLELQARYDLKV